jgi:hypothetical protein
MKTAFAIHTVGAFLCLLVLTALIARTEGRYEQDTEFSILITTTE